MSIRWPVLLLVLALLGGGCATSDLEKLDDELLQYRYEHEKVRREELERLYDEEKGRCEELTRQILELRREIGLRRGELEELRASENGTPRN